MRKGWVQFKFLSIEDKERWCGNMIRVPYFHFCSQLVYKSVILPVLLKKKKQVFSSFCLASSNVFSPSMGFRNGEQRSTAHSDASRHWCDVLYWCTNISLQNVSLLAGKHLIWWTSPFQNRTLRSFVDRVAVSHILRKAQHRKEADSRKMVTQTSACWASWNVWGSSSRPHTRHQQLSHSSHKIQLISQMMQLC